MSMEIKSEVLNTVMYWSKVIILGIIVGVSIQFAFAWTAPSSAPPAGNTSGPLTVSAVNQTKAGKLATASTIASDSGTTLVTKDYVDAAAATPIRGGHYGGCIQQLNSASTNISSSNMAWPITSCPGTGTAQPTCASGYTLIKLAYSQGNTGAFGVDPADGHSRYNDLYDTSWRTTACAKL